ncbi:MAG TPA: phosphodiester glycosidase family protein [Candidatus Limiplasma sp.]|nr:phosphodiester glycosidase family protein [Candidatus Limiplasma sp.]
MKKRFIAIIALILVLTGCFGIGAGADTAYSANIKITITTASGNKQETVVTTAVPGQWQTPCINAPYDYQYQDDTRFIAIDKVSEDGITYFVADVQLADAAGFKTALSGGTAYGDLEQVSDMARQNNAILAINGDDYATQKYGTIIRNGTLIRANATTRNMLIVDQNGDMSVLSDRKGENPKTLSQKLISQNVMQTFEFGPELVRDGEAVDFNRAFDVISTSSTRREPRTAIGQIDTLHYIIIVADGRQEGYSVGMTLPELQQLFIQYGAQTAMNLDGGGSSELWFLGDVLNRPAGGEERYISDIIFF